MLFDLKLTVTQVLIIISVVGGACAGYVSLAAQVDNLANKQEEMLQEFKEFRKETREDLKRIP